MEVAPYPFELVLNQMLNAGRLLEYSYTDERGWTLGWTEKGAARAIRLARLFQSKVSNDSLQSIGEFFEEAAQELCLQDDDAVWLLEDILQEAGFTDAFRPRCDD